MLRKISAILLALVLILCAANAESGKTVYDGESDLEGVETRYHNAREYEGKYLLNKAYEEYTKTLNDFAQHPDLMTFKYAGQYYYYADGRLKLRDGDYKGALASFNLCLSKYVEDVDYFKSFINGVILFEEGEYEAAVTYFDNARACELLFTFGVNEYYIKALNLKEEASKQARDEERKKQEDEKTKAEREAAMEARAKTALSLSLKATKDGITIKWDNLINTYVVCVSPLADPPSIPQSIGKADNNSKISVTDEQAGKYSYWGVEETAASECSLEIKGLWKGTKYYVWLFDRQEVAPAVCKTVTTQDWENSGIFDGEISYLLYMCDKNEYGNAYDSQNYNGKPEVSPHGILYQRNYCQKVSDKKTITVSNDSLETYSYYVVLTFMDMSRESMPKLKKDIEGKTVELYFAVNGSGTVKIASEWPMEQVLFLLGNDNKVSLYYGDLLDKYEDVPAGVTYTFTFVVDGEKVFSCNGVTQ